MCVTPSGMVKRWTIGFQWKVPVDIGVAALPTMSVTFLRNWMSAPQVPVTASPFIQKDRISSWPG